MVRPAQRTHGRAALVVATLIGVLGTTVTLLAAGPTSAATTIPSLRFPVVATGYLDPVQVTSADDGIGRLFVVERQGTLRTFINGQRSTGTYLDIRDRVNDNSSERGMLGVAFAPDFATRPYLYVTYTRWNGDLVVSRFRAPNARAAYAYASSEAVLFTVPRPTSTYSNHNGGSIAFGPDGLLYIGTGDGGGSGDPARWAQDKNRLAGKILRVDPRRSCNGRPYCVPSTNPLVGQGGRGEIFLYGVRNPWRFSFDAANGDLWIGDVGQDQYEEINLVVPSTIARTKNTPINLGWSCMEGRVAFNSCAPVPPCPKNPIKAPNGCDRTDLRRAPMIAYCHQDLSGCADEQGGQSVTGGFVYRGRLSASAMSGVYVYADFISGNVWGIRRGVTGVTHAANLPYITSFGEDDNRELWAVTIDGTLRTVKPL